MFSPIVAIFAVSVSSTDLPFRSAALSASTSSTDSAAPAKEATISWNSAFLPTKSVSEFTSSATAVLPSTATATRPSAAVRPDFFAAFARPLVRSQSTAASMSPSVSVNAFFASIMPAPVVSRSSFTNAAVIAISGLLVRKCRGRGFTPSRYQQCDAVGLRPRRRQLPQRVLLPSHRCRHQPRPVERTCRPAPHGPPDHSTARLRVPHRRYRG